MPYNDHHYSFEIGIRVVNKGTKQECNKCKSNNATTASRILQQIQVE